MTTSPHNWCCAGDAQQALNGYREHKQLAQQSNSDKEIALHLEECRTYSSEFLNALEPVWPQVLEFLNQRFPSPL